MSDFNISNKKQYTEGKRRTGFTLIELLVVVAIIGLFSSVVMASLNSVRREGRNTFRNQSMGEYVKAVNLHYATYGEYPNPGNEGLYCLAKVPQDCIIGTINQPSSNTINTALSPYIEIGNPFPLIDRGGPYLNFEGPFYSCDVAGIDWILADGECTRIYFMWFLEGDRDCGGGAQGGYMESAGATICQLFLE